MLSSITASAVDGSLYVGEHGYLSGPSYTGIMDAISWYSDHKNDILISGNSSGADILIQQYFSGVAKIECQYGYHYYVGTKRYNKTGHLVFTLTCKKSSVTFDKKNVKLQPDETTTLTYSNSSGFKIPYGRWISSDPKIAIIDEEQEGTGKQTVKIKALKPGKCDIIFGANSGDENPSCTITVEEVPAKSISLSPSKLTIQEGSSAYFKISLVPSNSSSTIKWTTNDGNIASVNSNGLIKGIKAGTTTITATTDNGHSASGTVVITPLPTSVTLGSENTVFLGYSLTLIPELSPSNATTSYKWESDNSDIVSVDQNGTIKAHSLGQATISVETKNGLKATRTINVQEAPQGLDIANVLSRLSFLKKTYKLITQKQITSMKARIFKITIIPYLAISLAIVTGCASDTIIDNPDIPSEITNSLNKISTNWLAAREEIKNHMKGYTLSSESTDEIEIYDNPKDKSRIAYHYKNDKLISSALMVALEDSISELNTNAILKNYTYIGNINEEKIYSNSNDNTLVCYWTKIPEYPQYTCIGFSPINSDLIGSTEKFSVKTGEVEIESTKATFKGEITGEGEITEAGFIFGQDPNLDKSKARKTALENPSKSYSITVNGIINEAKYYYRSYAIIEGVYYYGDIKTFDTPELFYIIDGKKYKMIKIKGAPYGDICVMQTEIIPTKSFKIVDFDMEMDIDGDGKIVLWELRDFLNILMKKTGLVWRLPTSQEWMIAATGGDNSENFIYSGSNDINEVGWYRENTSSAQPPALKKANSLGFYDMTGNYAELTNDLQIENLNKKIYLSNSTFDWKSSHSYGGSWNQPASECTIKSHSIVPGISKNIIDPQYYSFRFVISCEKSYDEVINK